jgi:hypothetical protein
MTLSTKAKAAGLEVNDVVPSKVLRITMAHLTKKSSGIFESDAAPCFERIVLHFAFLCFKALGALDKLLQMWEAALYNAIHGIQTGYGDSEGTYPYTKESPIIGPGQGSRSGVAAICALSTILMRTFDKMGHGSRFCDPTQKHFYDCIAQMYFDDGTKNYMKKFISWLHSPADQLEVVEKL